MDNDKIKHLVRKFFIQVIDTCSKQAKTYYDFMVSINFAEGKIVVSDDDDAILGEEIIFGFIRDERKGIASEEVIPFLRSQLHLLYTDGVFNEDFIGEPFSITYITDEEPVELLFIYEDQLLLERPLLENVGEELDTFFRDLFSE